VCSLELPALEPYVFVVLFTVGKVRVPYRAAVPDANSDRNAPFPSTPPKPAPTAFLSSTKLFRTHAVIESVKLDSGSGLARLEVDGDMANRDLAMEVLADVGGFEVVRLRCAGALLAASAVGLFEWDIMGPEMLVDVNTVRSKVFAPRTTAEERVRRSVVGGVPWSDPVGG